MNKSYRNQNLVKPQLAFNRKPDNSDTSPWKPLLKTKPHAKLPLKTSLSTFEDELQHKQYDHAKFLPLLISRTTSASSAPSGSSTPSGSRLNHNRRARG